MCVVLPKMADRDQLTQSLSECVWLPLTTNDAERAWGELYENEHSALMSMEVNTPIKTFGCFGMSSSYIVAAGPFVTSPGSWVNFEMFVRPPPSQIIASVGDVVSSDMRYVVGYPPIHVHHIHMRDLEDLTWHRFETHGDYFNIKNNSYVMELPDGYCATHTHRQHSYNPTPELQELYSTLIGETSASPPRVYWNDMRERGDDQGALLVRGIINDVRTDPTPLTWYVRVGFEYKSGRDCERVDKLIMVHTHPSPDTLNRYMVPTSEACLLWWHGTFTVGGRVRSMWRHAHRHRDDGFLLFGSTFDVASIVSEVSGADFNTNARQLLLNKHGSSLIANNQVNISTCSPFLKSVECYDRPSIIEWDANLVLKKGQEYTSVVFHSPGQYLFPSHHLIFMWYSPAFEPRDKQTKANEIYGCGNCGWKAAHNHTVSNTLHCIQYR